MIKKLLIGISILLLIPLTIAYLGIYEPGEAVTYSVVCLTDEGIRDTGCLYINDSILAPNETSTFDADVAIAEVSDTNLPGLWRGNYTVPMGAAQGTWSIYLALNNSNNTKSGTVLHFQTVGGAHGIDSIGNKTAILPGTMPVSWDDAIDVDTLSAQVNSNFTTFWDRTISSISDTASRSFDQVIGDIWNFLYANNSMKFYYNISSFAITNVTNLIKPSGLNFTDYYYYSNESFLNETRRVYFE